MTADQCRERLLALLTSQNQLIEQANDYLLAIKQAIAENGLANLQQSLAGPGLAVDEIERLEQQRHDVVQRCGFERNNDGFRRCIDWCDDERGQVAACYEQWVQALLTMQHSLQISSLLIVKGQQRVRRSIGILTGLGPSANCKTYSSEGKAIDPVGSRDIAIA